MAQQAQTTGGVIKEWIVTLVYVVVIAVVIRSFLFEPFFIPSGSLTPTLLPGDFVLVTKYNYGYSRWSFPFGEPDFNGRIFGSYPKQGQIAVFALPSDPSIDYIKRVIGEPGSTVQVTNGQLILNGTQVPRAAAGAYLETPLDDGQGVPINVQLYKESLPDGVTHLIAKATDQGFANNTQVYTVPPGHVFMMGDNRDFSEDSRFLDAVGYIPVENFVGRARIVWFSIRLDHPWWQVWYWPVDIRWDRLFTVIK
jgi:signal peptidase I